MTARDTAGRPLCDACSDPIEPDERSTLLAGRKVHAECASETRRLERVPA